MSEELDQLGQLREAIDALDGQIVDLLNERARLAQEIGRIKERSGHPVYVPGRAEQLMRRLAVRNKGPLTEQAIRAIYREIMSASLALEKNTIIAVEGAIAGLTHLAAKEHFGSSVRYTFHQDSDSLVEAVISKATDCGVIPFYKEGPGGGLLELLSKEKSLGKVFLCAQIVLGAEQEGEAARYFVIGATLNGSSGDDQTALLIHLTDQPGALAAALEPFREVGVNVLSIYSRRSLAGGLYLLLEVEGHAEDALIRRSLESLKSVGMNPMVCGSYPRFH
jgi:chorismate mutase-like protein